MKQNQIKSRIGEDFVAIYYWAVLDSASQCHLLPCSKQSKLRNVRLRPKITDTVKGKLILGAKLLQAGGMEKGFKKNYSVRDGKKLLKASQCYLSTTFGPKFDELIPSFNWKFHENAL